MKHGPFWIAVISTRRPEAVGPMTALIGPATWYVGAEDTYDAPSVRAGGLVAARNQALHDAFEQGLMCVQVSDDLVKVERLDDRGAPHPFGFAQALDEMRTVLRGTDYRLAGVAPTANPFYGRPRTAGPQWHHFVVGDLMLVRETPLRFDAALKLKEDYDYTCAHIARYGGVARLDWLLLTFRHRSNAGGAVDVRTAEREQEAIAYLKEKWPGWIRDNPRRRNEVLLRAL